MDIAKSETFKNFIILDKALLFLIKWYIIVSCNMSPNTKSNLLLYSLFDDKACDLPGLSTRHTPVSNANPLEEILQPWQVVGNTLRSI